MTHLKKEQKKTDVAMTFDSEESVEVVISMKWH